jgi:hypothetical protein
MPIMATGAAPTMVTAAPSDRAVVRAVVATPADVQRQVSTCTIVNDHGGGDRGAGIVKSAAGVSLGAAMALIERTALSADVHV